MVRCYAWGKSSLVQASTWTMDSNCNQPVSKDKGANPFRLTEYDSLLSPWSSSGRMLVLMLMLVSALNEVIRRPGTGELHLAFLHLLHGRGVLVLVALDGLVVDQVGDIEKHLAGVHPPARDLFCQGKEHAMHLHRKRPRSGLAFPLTAGALTKARQILLSDGHIAQSIAWAGVVDQDFEVHLRLAAKAFDVGQEVALVGTDRASQRVVVLKGSSEAERQDRRVLEAVSDNTSVIFLGLLIHSCAILRIVLGDDHRKIAGWKEKGLITEQTRNSGQRHWATMPAKLRKGLSFCNAIGVPCHRFYPSMAQGRAGAALSGSWLMKNSY